jgi:PleD family two-component response regulator
MTDALRRKVLLVDDSTTALVMEEVLLRSQFEIVKATSGAQALELAANVKPDLILLDVVMPGMDGFETCRRLRSLDATRTTPILMVSTRGQPENVAAASAAGASGYVTKPIVARHLRSKIQECLEGTADRAE